GRSSIYSRQLARVMSQEDMTLFEWLFEDAYLVDVDLSSWTEHIALYLVAPHAAERYGKELRPLFIVEFLRVRSWDCAFHHLDPDPADEDGPRHPIMWRIEHFAVQPVAGGLQFACWGRAEHPRMTIVCERMMIRVMPGQIPERLFPGRLKPPYRFIRPGLDELARDHWGDVSSQSDRS
ncbi:MAG TPA: hypothetical protein VFL91_24915, partial [Thermomicrobiales bacterium]|nr:hypothetical protein [Thermomicrobiales bacterium]